MKDMTAKEIEAAFGYCCFCGGKLEQRGKSMTPAQKKLAKKHGTLEEFTKACEKAYDGLMISYKEMEQGIERYEREWKEAGKEYK